MGFVFWCRSFDYHPFFIIIIIIIIIIDWLIDWLKAIPNLFWPGLASESLWHVALVFYVEYSAYIEMWDIGCFLLCLTQGMQYYFPLKPQINEFVIFAVFGLLVTEI
jgi:predicted ABC-type exoprotein transport system permease subunit